MGPKKKRRYGAGFSMTSRTRPLVISKLDTYMRERTPIIRSKRLIDELFVFIWNGSRAEAQRGYNDDLVISFSTGLWVRDIFKTETTGNGFNKNNIDSY